MNAGQINSDRLRQTTRALPRALLVTLLNDADLPLTSEDQIHLVLAIARTQDRSAFERLFRHFGPRLKTFVMRRGLNATVAEEIVQETMLAVWRKASYFDASRAGAATWIFTIARNLSIDHQRRDRSGEAVDDDPSEEAQPPISGEDALIAGERDDRVRAALKSLSAEQLAVVKLSFFSEKPHVEIAEELGIPLGTVKSRVRLAMQRLRSQLEDLS
jgi:RNA polymerase sigma-70 factor (ECF subfamily)